jgi:hypothetical protein
VGWVRRDPLSSHASRIAAVPAIPEAKATATAAAAPAAAVGTAAANDDGAGSARDQPSSAVAATALASASTTRSSADGKIAPGARASLTPRGGSPRRVHHTAAGAAAGARRAIVDELEPSPYVRR